MEIFIIIVLLVIAVETTYLTISGNRKNGRMLQSPVFIDTSVLIDGRIVAIAESGFVSRSLYIPRSVVGELQFLADNADTEKRGRARHGLDVISQLQELKNVKVVIFNDSVRADEGVDNRLLELAKKNGGAICTIDYNLNKVAVVEGIEVLNVNELAKSLRMAYLPGERTLIELTQKGNDSHQAVGHLSDGTMVVVEHAYKQIGSAVEVEFIRGLQTAAGKMMFAKLVPVAEKAKPVQKQAKQAAKLEKRVKPVGRREVTQAASDVSVIPRTKPVRQLQPKNERESVAPAKVVPAKPQRANNRNSKRRSSPEDSMVELANRL